MVKKNLDDIKSGQKLKRIDWEIVECIIELLRHYPNKKTNIAMRCNMNYDRCIMYLRWLKMLKLVKTDDEDGFEVFSLTANGIELYEIIFGEREYVVYSTKRL